MTKPKSAGEIAEQLWAEGYLCDPDGPDDGVLTIGGLQAAVAQIIDSATCCGCVGLREALLHIFAESDATTCGFCEEIHRMAKQALSTPCTCQGATGEDAKRLDWLERNYNNIEHAGFEFREHRLTAKWGSLREAIDAALRRVQERKEV